MEPGTNSSVHSRDGSYRGYNLNIVDMAEAAKKKHEIDSLVWVLKPEGYEITVSKGGQQGEAKGFYFEDVVEDALKNLGKPREPLGNLAALNLMKLIHSPIHAPKPWWKALFGID